MGVQLNIKDPETVRLARELAGRTGLSITESIRGALERDLAMRESEIQERITRAIKIADNFRRHMPADWHGKTSKQIMDEIYDDDSLPA